MITETTPTEQKAKPFNWPLWSGLALLVAACVATFFLAVGKCQGHFIYRLDDAYIHLAIAKNLAHSGVFGVTPYAFTPAASSLIWPLLLALGIKLLGGLGEYLPLALNILFAGGLIAVAERYLARHVFCRITRFAFILGLMVLVPLIPLIFCGMEHVMQCLVFLAFTVAAAITLSENKRGLPLLALAPFVTLVRYEGMFLAALVVGLFLLKKRFRDASLIAVLALIPIAVFGVYSLSQGGHFLPTSVLIKGSRLVTYTPDAILAYTMVWYHQLLKTRYLFALVVAAVAVLVLNYRQEGLFAENQLGILIFLCLTVAHTQFNPWNGIYRYEAYLITWGLTFVTVGAFKLFAHHQKLSTPFSHQLPFYLLALVALGLLGQRGYRELANTPRGSKNIYEQQIQMARFVKAFYQHQPIAANDIGALTYYPDIKCVDLAGLGDLDIAKKIIQGTLKTPEQVQKVVVAKRANIAMIYDDWFTDKRPPQWTKVGEWQLPDNYVCGKPTVAFYAINPAERAALAANLAKFQKELPPDVVVGYPRVPIIEKSHPQGAFSY